MFTGIVTDIGRVAAIRMDGDTVLSIETAYAPEGIDLGASIACSGVCLTVTEKGQEKGVNWFRVAASAETLSKTSLGGWRVGSRINLERALRLGDELGGHLMLGHVDGIARLVSVTPEGDSHRLVLQAPADLARYVAPKGSVCLDGISLTVNAVEDRPDGTADFGINIVGHTWTHTTLADRRPGDGLNMEIDVLARYVARLTARD
ncbi:riboflavin synthase [Oceanibaculum nanhaiense]|uniref:riboflavin synthase n=1 Tax=Oceanibaculum nanhaiense TaxID=1909734 RepID=UPI003D26B97E